MAIRSRARSALLGSLSIEDDFNRGVAQSILYKLLSLGHHDAALNTRTNDGLFHLDISIPSLKIDGRSTVIEILEPMHVAVNTDQPLGRWLVRRRLLGLYDYHVLTLKATAWLAAPDKGDLLEGVLSERQPAHVA